MCVCLSIIHSPISYTYTTEYTAYSLSTRISARDRVGVERWSRRLCSILTQGGALYEDEKGRVVFQRFQIPNLML